MKLRKSLKIGITGSRGFIGSHIIDIFKKRGAKSFSFDKPENNLLQPKPAALKKFVKNSDVIIHAAAVNRGGDIEVIAGSVAATYNLISAMEKYSSKAKLIYLSSIQAETDTLYGKSKRLTEIMLEDFSKKNKISVSIFKLTNLFGEGCKPFYNSVVATFCYQAANGKELTVNPKSKNKKINLIYVGDAVRIIAKEAFTNRADKFYFKRIDSKNTISVGDLANLIELFKKNKFQAENKFQKDLYKTYLSYKNGK